MAEKTPQKQRVTMTWESDPNQLIVFDAVTNEDHSGSAEMTDHPIEAGGDTTDHIRRLRDELMLVGVVTDDPLIVNRSTDAKAANTGGDPAQRAVSAYDFLTAAKDAGRLFRVFTTLREYRNMAINSIKVTRNADRSRIVQADIFLREIMIGVTERVDAPVPAEPTRKKKVKKGKQNLQPETDANKDKAKGKLRSIGSRLGGDQLTSFLDQGPF